VPRPSTRRSPDRAWTFLTHHAQVLLCIAADPDSRMRDVAGRVNLTERAVQRIVAELADGGYLTVIREGRRNRYEVNRGQSLRHPIEAHRTVGHLIDLGLGSRARA
jgi:hypothetical protein